MLLHNGGFCNGCITKRCLHDSTNVSYNDLFSRLFYDKKKMKLNAFCQMFLSFMNNIGFLMKGKLISTKSVCDAAAANSPLSSSTRRKLSNFQATEFNIILKN